MAGEAERTFATKELDAENNQKEKKLASEQFKEKALKGSPEHFQNVCVETKTVNNNTKFVEKEKDNTQQREAVIRPQQAGKIDFKSLQNRSNFTSDRTWPNGKVSPQSLSGKGRIRDKGKRSGKAERANPQQLCRLSTTNSRSNPTIGIAYPQQKLSPPKKLEASRGPVSGSYRLYVPNIPEREAELQQEEFNLNRCFQEGSNLISPSYTSQPVGAAAGSSSHQHPASTAPQQKPGALETNNAPVNQMIFPDFQLSGADMWQAPDRAFSNASFGVTAQKSNNFGDINKPNGCVPLPFQYGYPLLDNANSFHCDQNPQPQALMEASLGPSQVTQNSFSFQASGEDHEVVQNNAKLSYEQSEDRQYSLHSNVQTPHAIQSSVHCTRNIADGVSNGDSKEPNCQQPDKKKSSLSDKSVNYSQVDTKDVGARGQRGCHSKTSTSNQRILVQGSVHHIRNVSQSPQIHFSKKSYNSSPTNVIHVGSAPLDKNSRVAQPWEAPNKAFTLPLDQNSSPYPFQCQAPPEQRQNAGINGRMPWQQIRLTIPNQNRIEISRNKSLYYAVNHAVHGSTQRTPTYPPLHVPSMELLMASPYDSPSHSPIQNQLASSTCSSLSPNSTSPASSSSDDSQKASPSQIYNQVPSKTSLDNLSSNQHQYHSEVSRSLRYNQEKSKENIVSFSSNMRQKSNMENGKSCLNSNGMERHPPPPYSAHQLLASSLATANLEQLDVVLTCKQCDQNFNNLASFLDHKQYCGQHTFAQNDFMSNDKDIQKVEDTRKFHPDHTKSISSGTNFAMSRSSSDLHVSLLGLNKNGEIMPDSVAKVDAKDDPMKLMLPSAPLPDLEMEDAKLDSLITETLNGLGYQSDNAEIDSSFIDAFADDEITTTKCSSSRQTVKTKDSVMFEDRGKHEFTSSEKSLSQQKYTFDDFECLTAESKHANVTFKENNWDLEAHKEGNKEETSVVKRKSTLEESNTHKEWVKETQKSYETAGESELCPRFSLSRNSSGRGGLKTLQSSTPSTQTPILQSPSATRSPTPQRPIVKERKRKRISGGSWSKELIHKIVHQKNKLRKLHVKGTKNMQFSLVMERVTPTVQNPTFREYDYISDSDEDCEPVKIASQGRLSQSIRCKYTYTKECKERIRADKNRESPWKQDKIESFELKKGGTVSPSPIKEISGHQRVRRRSSRSSTSSELSTSVSVSSESNSSPKSIDCTDSDCEKRVEIKKKDQESFDQDRSPQRILKESSTSLALTFTKNTKHYSTDKILLSELKDSFTTSKCSNVISTTEETASEHTLTKSTVSLARYKTTRVEVEKKKDHYGSEIGIAANTEEATPLIKDYNDYKQASMHLRRTGVTTNSVKTKNNKEIQKDHASSMGKTLCKTQESHQESESLPASFENFSNDISATKPDQSDLFSEPPSLCGSLMDEVCLSSDKINDALPDKDRVCLMPYTLEHEQSLMKSPLSFDTTSMFGDLTVGGYDNNLYPDIQLNKEGFGPIESVADKKELFESSFSPILEQRHWSAMVDVTPELPDEISQCKEESDISSDKKSCFNPGPFTPTEKIMDYHPTLNGCVTDDDMEIKRIVTLLESQLQSAKLSSPSPLENDPPKHLTMSKFSPLRLDDHETESERRGMEVVCPSESLGIVAPTDTHSELFSEPDLPWSSPVQFGLMGGQQCLHTPTHSTVADTPVHLGPETLHVKSDAELNILSAEKSAALNNEEITESSDSFGSATNKSEEMIEQEIYTENLMKSLEVISDSLSSGLESAQSSVQQEEYIEELEKEDGERTEKTGFRNVSEEVGSIYCVAEHLECSSDLNETLLEEPPKLITGDICESNLGNKMEISSDFQSNDASLHNKDAQLNELQPANPCVSINESKLPPIIFDSKTSTPVGAMKFDSEPDVVEDFNLEACPNDPNASTTLPDVVKDESTKAHKQESSQLEKMLIETNASKDKDRLESPAENHSSQDKETEIDTVERAGDNVKPDNSPVLQSIKSPQSQDGKSYEILRKDTDTVSTHEQSQLNKEDPSCEATLRMPFSDAQNVCGGNLQINMNENPKLKSVPPISPSPLVSPYVPPKSSPLQRENNLLSSCWTNINRISPTLIDKTLPFKGSADVDIAKSLHAYESSSTATEINHSFASNLNFAETTKRKISLPRTMLAVDRISKQAFYESNEKSEILNVTQNKDPLYEFKLSPMNYSKTHFTSSLSSKTLHKGIDVPSNIKSNPKDSLNLNACALTLNTQLSSNCRLSPIHVQNELELTTYDQLVKLDMPHFQDTVNQNDIKFCISPRNNHPAEDRASDDTEQLSKLHQGNMSTCHAPIDSIDYMDLNINILRRVDAENVEGQITTFKQDALPKNPVIPNIQETPPNPKEQLPAGSLTLTSLPNSLMGQCTKQSEVKSLPKKGGTQNAVQGKFQCEICLMFFRTLPGLKRHKAMKHTVKSELLTAQKQPLNSQSFVPHLVDKDLKDNTDLDPVAFLKNSADGTPARHCDLAAMNSVFEDKPKESFASKSTTSNDKDDVPPITEKAKKNNKDKRRKSTDSTNEGFIHKLAQKDPFPDELLSILKTDILQAISPDFPAVTQPECPRSSGKLSTANSPNYQEVKVTEDLQGLEGACVDEQEIIALPKCPEMYHHTAEADNTTAKPENCANLNMLENNEQANDTISEKYLGIEEICHPCEDPSTEIKSETMCYTTDENGSHSEDPKDPPISPRGLGSDFKDLFDDENTFSQLFPSNEMKRKKCARVYGKSNKKHKQMQSLLPDYTGLNSFSDNNEEYKKKPDNIFPSSREQHCEYKTISLDDAKMLEMCHKSTLKNPAENDSPQDVTKDLQTMPEDNQEGRISDFIHHTEDAILTPTGNLNGSEDKDTGTGSDGKENSKSDEPCPLPLVCVQDNVPRYPSIDIQNFNTTFQLPEMPLFESERDMSVVEAIVVKKSPKKPTECKNRKRIETGLKPKDKQYKCKVCFTWFLTLGELDFHKLSHNPSPPPTCYMCVQRKFSSREQLRDHLKEKHVKNKAGAWTCGMCLKEISDVWMYNEHLREHATQFARKGQSQSSLLDMPGCFMQENAVKNFISSIMKHQSKKGENAKPSREDRKDVSGVMQQSSDTCELETIKSKVVSAGGGSKHSIFTPHEVLPKANTTPKNVEMHPNCKDPSRDCHHCGKQFPKPFKLQRHLVVHNLQKIFMCHKCPVSYQQANELKEHLKIEHEEVDEPDSKHTTLYTCELCADVMHVIKKSFICSTCNYTFSKKEQFDRHMEKHLTGGSKIFKFRGVVRPCRSKEDDMPSNKKRKLLPENSRENCLNLASIPSVHLRRSTDRQGLEAVMDNSCNKIDEEEQPTEKNNTSVKMEDVAEDLSGALEELEHHQLQLSSAKNTLKAKTMTKEEDTEDLEHAHDVPNTKEVGTDYKDTLTEICDVKVEDDCGATQTTSQIPIPNESRVPDNKMKECTNLVNAAEETGSNLCTLQFPNQTSKSTKSFQTDVLRKEDYSIHLIRLPSLSSEINQQRRDQINQCASIRTNENESAIDNADQPICAQAKEGSSGKSEENAKQCIDNGTKPRSIGVTDAAGVNHAKISLRSITADDKDCVKLKKKKDLKAMPSSPRTASAVTRENLGIDPKVKKKFRSNKCERVAGQRKGDISADYPVLTSVKDEMTSNKIVSKNKTGTPDLQPKRGSDKFSPKKGDIHHLNWDCRGKKGVPGRTINSATSKMSVTSLNNSFKKPRPKLGVKPVETQSYHTAESHNNLLSKLFGQRLTGFKIPLRKDTSEPIN